MLRFRRLFLPVLVGVATTLALLVSLRPDWIRAVWAQQMLSATPRLMDSVRANDAPVMPAGCTFDATPVAVGDGDYQMLRCANNTGSLAVATPAGVPLETDWQQTNGADVAVGAGAVGVNTPRFTLATDDVVSVDDGAGSLTVDSAQFPAALVGGRLDVVVGAELPAGVQNIGDVDVLTMPLTEVQGDQVTPSTQTTVACDDTGAVALTFQADTVRAELWNTSASDVCLRWGTAGVPDRTTLTTCSVVLGAHAGSGTPDVYATPAGFRVGAEAFECDTVAAPGNLVAVEWRTQ